MSYYKKTWRVPSQYLLAPGQQWKHQNTVGSVNNVVLLYLWSTLNRVHILVWCFDFWLWTSKSQLVSDVAYLTKFFLIFFIANSNSTRTVPEDFSVTFSNYLAPTTSTENFHYSHQSPDSSILSQVSVSNNRCFNGKFSSKNKRTCNISYPGLLHFLNVFVHIFSRLENITCL